MTPTLSKSCSDTQAPNPRFSATWAYGAFGLIVLQRDHHVIHMFRLSFSIFDHATWCLPNQTGTRGLRIPTAGEGRVGLGSVWHVEKCLLGCGYVWVVGRCVGLPVPWVGGACVFCSSVCCVRCLLGRERHSVNSGCVFFLVWWVFGVPSWEMELYFLGLSYDG